MNADSPIWNTKLGSPQCVPSEIYSTASLPAYVSPSTGKALSLSDFLTPTKQASVQVQKSWSSPSSTSVAKKSLAEIQAEEQEFSTRQDRTYEKGGGTWFIERKERADSLLEIQNNAKEEQERLEFIEEQKRIEEQIRNDLVQQEQQKQKQKNKRNGQMKKNATRKSQNGNPTGSKATTNRRSSRQNSGTRKVDHATNTQAGNNKNGKGKKHGSGRGRKRMEDDKLQHKPK